MVNSKFLDSPQILRSRKYDNIIKMLQYSLLNKHGNDYDS